tara:strand:- start:907 stop:1119 length:213 start_codon:yes stop_codon:yes gene_type:complete
MQDISLVISEIADHFGEKAKENLIYKCFGKHSHLQKQKRLIVTMIKNIQKSLGRHSDYFLYTYCIKYFQA